MPRPSWTEYFLRMAYLAAERSTCDRKHVGAVVVDPRYNVVSTGYNGSPRGLPHCDDAGHELREINGKPSCVRTIHAEENALLRAGERAYGCTLYVTCIPCYDCAKRVLNSGVQKVIYAEHYESRNTDLVLDMLHNAGVKVLQVEVPK